MDSSPRFVVLRHETPADHQRGPHWDLMLEQAGSLRTWALAGDPCGPGPIQAQELAYHRLAYLDYEGPLTGNRGTVSRWDHGNFALEQGGQNELVLALCGERLRGQATLRRAGPADYLWIFSFTGDST